jgi:hypothetical protein
MEISIALIASISGDLRHTSPFVFSSGKPAYFEGLLFLTKDKPMRRINLRLEGGSDYEDSLDR